MLSIVPAVKRIKFRPQSVLSEVGRGIQREKTSSEWERPLVEQPKLGDAQLLRLDAPGLSANDHQGLGGMHQPLL